MNAIDLSKFVGEWFGNGTMTMGSLGGTIEEYVRIEATDLSGCLAYIRHSRIVIAGQIEAHNEQGYMRASDITLMLSRGSYVVLTWDPALGLYSQTASSPDTRNMTRKVTLSATGTMTWDSRMEVEEGTWVPHTILTNFDFLSLTNLSQFGAKRKLPK